MNVLALAEPVVCVCVAPKIDANVVKNAIPSPGIPSEIQIANATTSPSTEEQPNSACFRIVNFSVRLCRAAPLFGSLLRTPDAFNDPISLNHNFHIFDALMPSPHLQLAFLYFDFLLCIERKITSA